MKRIIIFCIALMMLISSGCSTANFTNQDIAGFWVYYEEESNSFEGYYFASDGTGMWFDKNGAFSFDYKITGNGSPISRNFIDLKFEDEIQQKERRIWSIREIANDQLTLFYRVQYSDHEEERVFVFNRKQNIEPTDVLDNFKITEMDGSITDY